MVDVVADLQQVTVTGEGRPLVSHAHCWASAVTMTNPAHVDSAARLRAAFANRDRAGDAATLPSIKHGEQPH